MKYLVPALTTSQIWQIFIQDSTNTAGLGLAGLTAASVGLTAYYHRDFDSTATQISLGTMVLGAFSSAGFREIDGTNMPGWYQFCPPNLCFTAAVNNVGIFLKGAAAMAPLPIEAQVINFNIMTATPSVNVTQIGGSAASATSGVVNVTSNIKKNSASRLTFVMTDATTHAPKTGCSVTPQVSLDGSALGACVNGVTEIGSGLYTIVLAAADTNADELAYRFTATNADDLVIERVTQP